MHKLRSLLPSGNSLFTFEAAARHESFTQAAKELRISQPAVSKSVRLLEEYLGVQLFHRRHRAIELTAEGHRFYEEVAAGFDGLYAAARALRSAPIKDNVNALFSSVFINFWLLPRLDDFKSRFPEVTLHLDVDIRDDKDLVREGIDISSRLGDGDWQGLRSWYYGDEEIIAICSPDYLREHGAPGSIGDLPSHRLLRLEDAFRPKTEWPDWLRLNGVDAAEVDYALVLTDAGALLEAVLRGQGIALGWRHLVSDQLRDGSFVQPLPNAHATGYKVYLVAPADVPMKWGTRVFRDWLLGQAGMGRPPLCRPVRPDT